ncbi:MAG: PEP-CTERM sorting domain-containing protein [Phycisphaerales bacterium JB063]
MAAPYSPVIGDQVVTAASGIDIDISGGDIGATYTTVDISLDWTAGGGNPWSNEAGFGLYGAAGFGAPVYVPGLFGQFEGDADNGDATTLTFSGTLDAPYTGGDSLFFNGGQQYAGSDATWSNISITFNEGVFDAFDLSDTDTVAHGPGQYHMWDLVIDADGTEVQLNTLGTSTSETGFGVNDTELFLLDTDGVTLLATNDDFNGLRESQIVTFLDAGTYTLVAGTYDLTYDGSAFAVDSDGSGSIVVNASTRPGTGATLNFVSTVPEPGSLALLGLGGLALLRRRRSA